MFDFGTTKTLKRKVVNKEVLLEKVGDDYFVSYKALNGARHDRTLMRLLWNLGGLSGTKHVEKEGGWEHRTKIKDEWLNEDRRKALESLLAEAN